MPDFEDGGLLDRLEAAGRAQEQSEFDLVHRATVEADVRRMLHDYGYPEHEGLIVDMAEAIMRHVEWPG